MTLKNIIHWAVHIICAAILIYGSIKFVKNVELSNELQNELSIRDEAIIRSMMTIDSLNEVRVSIKEKQAVLSANNEILEDEIKRQKSINRTLKKRRTPFVDFVTDRTTTDSILSGHANNKPPSSDN